MAHAVPLIMALYRYDRSCRFNYHTACRDGNHSWKQHQLVRVHKPLTVNLDRSNYMEINDDRKILKFMSTTFNYCSHVGCIITNNLI